MIYPTGCRVTWRRDIPPRKGSQHGTLTRDWDRYESFPQIVWDGEESAHKELPECVDPAPLSLAVIAKQPATTSTNAWDEYERMPARRMARV